MGTVPRTGYISITYIVANFYNKMAERMDDKCAQVNGVTVPKNHTMCLKFDLNTASSCGRPLWDQFGQYSVVTYVIY